MTRSCRRRALGGMFTVAAWLSACAGDDGSLPPDEEACLRALTTFDGPREYVYSVDWSPIDDYVLAGTNEELRLFSVDTDAQEFELVATLDERPMAAVVDWSSDGQFALSAGLEVKLLSIGRDPPAITQLAAYTGHDHTALGIDWTQDGRYAVTASRDSSVRLLAVNAAEGVLAEQDAFYGHIGRVFGVSWSPDGRHAASVGEDGTVRVLEVDTSGGTPTLRQIAMAEHDRDMEAWASWTAHPDILLTGTWFESHLVQVWSVDTETGTLELLSEFEEHPTGVDTLEWTRDGQRIVTGGHDDTIRLSRVADGRLTSIAVLDDHTTGVHAVGWSPDETYLVMASAFVDRMSLVDARGCAAL